MRFKSINPATGKELREYETISENEALQFAERSYMAFNSWKLLSIKERSDYILRLAAILKKNSAKYSRTITEEMGKPIRESRAEIEKSAWTAELYGQKAEEWLSPEAVQTESKESIVAFEPIGPVLAVMPWNFPFWQALRFAIPTLLAGNTTILRHSNVVPESALQIEEAFSEAGFPKGVFKTIITDHNTVKALIESKNTAGLSVTGSTGVGASLAGIAASNLKKSVLELGGSDPFIVLEDADISFTVENTIKSRIRNAGQSCIAAKRFIVSENIYDEFAGKLAERMKTIKIGDPLSEDTDLGPVVNESQLKLISEQVSDAESKGASILSGGKRAEREGFFYLPTVVKGASFGMRVFDEEVFGPVAAIAPFKDESEAIKMANSTEFGLGGSIWTKDGERGKCLAKKIEAGTVSINGVVTSDPRMPFGGIKRSGLGRELSRYGLLEFVNIKSINLFVHGSSVK
jgi:acyl-CoA reductase-like NAD-dependent aldehyde dehydrogenase